jgi:hypothetical protein
MNANVASVVMSVSEQVLSLLGKLAEKNAEIHMADAEKFESRDLLELRLAQLEFSRHAFDSSIKELQETRAAVIEAQRAEIDVSRSKVENERTRLENERMRLSLGENERQKTVKRARRERW